MRPYRLRKHKHVNWGYSPEQIDTLRAARALFDRAWLARDENGLASAQQTFHKILDEISVGREQIARSS